MAKYYRACAEEVMFFSREIFRFASEKFENGKSEINQNAEYLLFTFLLRIKSGVKSVELSFLFLFR